MHYDGIMFGNGLTLNMLNQIKKFVPREKRYLLNINEFLKQWTNNKLTTREERKFYSCIYGQATDRWHYFEIIKKEITKYFEKYDADIEYTMGVLLFKESEYRNAIQLFPAIYNIWYIILKDYLDYLDTSIQISNFYKSVRDMTENPKYIWTTNFDLFGESIKPEHIHGKFLSQMKRYEDVVYKMMNNRKNYYYKYIWGHNGIGKLNNIQQLSQYSDCGNFFDFGYFFDNTIKMDRMFIYGMGFKKAGYVEELKTAYPKYENVTIGAIVDEHILIRIKGMQNLGLLNKVDISYFNEVEKKYLEEVMEAVNIKEYALVKCQDYEFNIA